MSRTVLMVFLSQYLEWINKLMFNSLNLITNNYFLKQKLKVPEFQSPIRKLTDSWQGNIAVSYTHLRAHETKANLVCRLLLEKKKIFPNT